MKTFIPRVNFLLAVLFVFFLMGTALGQAPRWDRNSATRAYNEIVREHNQTRTRLNEDLPDDDFYQLVAKLQDLRFRAQQIHFDLEVISGTNPDLQAKYRDLAASLTRDIETLKTR